MLPVFHQVVRIQLNQAPGSDYEEILRIPLLCRFGKIEGPGDNGNTIYYDDLGVGNGMLVVIEGGYGRVGKEGRGGILPCSLAHIEDSLYLYAPFEGRHEGLGYGCRGKGVGLDVDVCLTVADFFDNGHSTTSIGREVNVGRGVVQDQFCCKGLRAGQKGQNDEKGGDMTPDVSGGQQIRLRIGRCSRHQFLSRSGISVKPSNRLKTQLVQNLHNFQQRGLLVGTGRRRK